MRKRRGLAIPEPRFRLVSGIRLRRGDWAKISGLGRWAISLPLRLVDSLDVIIRRCLHFVEERLALFTAVALILAGTFIYFCWDWLQSGTLRSESGSTTLRNVGFVVAGLIALPFAIWRTRVADRQVSASQRQADVDEQELLDKRYSNATEMLESHSLTTRIEGINALKLLATQYAERYFWQVTNRLCELASNTVNVGAPGERAAEDTRAAMSIFLDRMMVGPRINRLTQGRTKLIRANLSGAILIGSVLAGVEFENTDLSEASLGSANLRDTLLLRISLRQAELRKASLQDAHLFDTDMSNADLSNALFDRAMVYRGSLTGAILEGAVLTGAVFNSVNGLTQQQVNAATADQDDPPTFEESFDPETGKKLIWESSG